MDIERLVVRILADASQYNRVADGVENRLIRLANAVGPIGNSLNLPITIATAALTGLGVAAATAAYQAVKMAASYEQAAIALEVMTGSADKGKQLLDEITKLAIESPFRTPVLLAGTQQLLAFGIEADNTINTLKVLGEVASGVGMDKLPRLILAYGQVRVAGRLMGPELRQFIDAGVPMIDYLAKVLGKPKQAIKGMVEEAKVSSNDVAKAFNMMVQEGGLFFKMMDRQSQSVTGRWSAFVETIELGLRNIGLAFFEEFKIAKNLDDLVKGMGMGNMDEIKATMKDIHGFFNFIVGLLKTAVFWIDRGWKSFKAWKEANQGTVEIIEKIVTKMAILLAIVATIALAVKALVLVFALLTSPIAQLILLLTTVTVILNDITDGRFGKVFEESFTKAFGAIKILGQALKDAIIGEDWELAGKIIVKSLQIGWKTLIHSIKWEFLGLIAMLAFEIGLFASHLMRYTEAAAVFIKEAADPGVKAGDARKNLEKRLTEIDRDVDEIRRKEVIRQQRIQNEEMNKILDPLRKDAAEMALSAAEKRMQKENPALFAVRQAEKSIPEAELFSTEWLKGVQDIHKRFATGREFKDLPDLEKSLNTNPFFKKAVEDYSTGILMRLTTEVFQKAGQPGVEEMVKTKIILPTDPAFKTVQQTAMTNMMMALMMDMPFRGMKVLEDSNPVAPNKIKIQPQVSAEALDYFSRINKEMEKGIWGGQRISQYDFFEKQLKLAGEGFRGPMGQDKSVVGRLFEGGGVMDRKQYEFSLFEEFSNLRKSVGTRSDRLPAAMFRGSSEAQDTINRNIAEQKTVEEEIRDTIMQAKIIQEEQRDYQKKTVEVLEKMIKEGTIKTGGF